MTLITKGLVSTVQFLDEPDVYEALIGVRAEERTVAEFFMTLGRFFPCSQSESHFFVNQPLFTSSTVSSFVDNSGTNMTDVTLTLDSADHGIIEGDVIMINSASVGFVTSVSGADVQVVAIPDGTGTQSGLTVANGDSVVVLSHAAAEGSGGAQSRWIAPKRYTYRVQIWKSSREITDIQHASPIEFEWRGQKLIFYEKEVESFTELMVKISNGILYQPDAPNSFMSTTPALTDAQGRAVNITRGLHSWITTGGGNDLGTNLAIDLAQLATINKTLDVAGASDTFVLMHGFDAGVAFDNTIKALNGTNLPNARLNVDGREVDLNLAMFEIYGRRFVKKKLNLLTLKGALGETNKSKDFFLVPMDDVPIDGGSGRVPRISLCYLPIPVEEAPNRRWANNGSIMMTLTGQLADGAATNNVAVKRVDHSAYIGLRVAGVEHMAFGSVA